MYINNKTFNNFYFYIHGTTLASNKMLEVQQLGGMKIELLWKRRNIIYAT